MKQPLDDLEAVRTLVDTLRPFERKDQERIIRWAQEKLGLSPPAASAPPPVISSNAQVDPPLPSKDIKTFVTEKNPRTDTEFAATVAYYYRFCAPEPERKECITANDLQDACRLVGRKRMSRPAQTLVNAHRSGLLDKAGERGAYAISTVGENLVAVTLPSSGGSQQPKSGVIRLPKRASSKRASGKTAKSSKKRRK